MKMHPAAALAILALVLVGLAAGPMTVSAGGDQVSRKDFALIGDVVAVDVAAGTLEVAPTSGFGYYGAAQVTIYTDAGTQFSPAGTSLASIAVGDEVRTSGRRVDGHMVAEVVVLAP